MRHLLERLLADLKFVPGDLAASGTTPQPELVAESDAEVDSTGDIGHDADGTIILEFGESRSEYFDYVLHLARSLDSYSQLMDEDRRLIYRIRFRKSKLRKFWRIWEYVQNWSSTRIYVDGDEIERWKVWPYSQFLR